jgi:nucleoid-associated protein EbfC
MDSSTAARGITMQPSMKMIQQMQNRMAKIQEELEQAEVEGTAGGGVVTATSNGQRELKAIRIDPSAVDPDDVEMLEDLVLTAVKDALDKAAALSEEKMSALTGGMKIPGLM